MRQQREPERDREPDRHRHDDQVDVLEQRRDVLVEVVGDPAGAEPVVRDAAVRALAVVELDLGEDEDQAHSRSATSSLDERTCSAGMWSACAMTSIDRTPTVAPDASTTGAYCTSASSSRPRASRMTSSTSTVTSSCGGSPVGMRSPRMSRWLIQRTGRRWASTTSATGRSDSSTWRRTASM